MFYSKIKKWMLLIISSEKLFKASEIQFVKMKRKLYFYINKLIFKSKTPTYTPQITVTPFEIKKISFFKIKNREGDYK